MSLNWNVSKTPAYAAKIAEHGDGEWQWDDREWGVLNTLIWATLVVDLPGMPKEEDLDEFIFRLRFAEKIGTYSPTLPDHDGPYTLGDLVALPEREASDGTTWAPYVTPEGEKTTKFGDTPDDVRYVSRYRLPTREEMEPFVGMTTNVSRKTRHQFVQRHAKMVRDEVERSIERAHASA